jgi:hypothetical protein
MFVKQRCCRDAVDIPVVLLLMMMARVKPLCPFVLLPLLLELLHVLFGERVSRGWRLSE